MERSLRWGGHLARRFEAGETPAPPPCSALPPRGSHPKNDHRYMSLGLFFRGVLLYYRESILVVNNGEHELGSMIDIHNHVLPGIDDGALTWPRASKCAV